MRSSAAFQSLPRPSRVCSLRSLGAYSGTLNGRVAVEGGAYRNVRLVVAVGALGSRGAVAANCARCWTSGHGWSL